MGKGIWFDIFGKDKSGPAFRSVRKSLNTTAKAAAGLVTGLGVLTAWQGAKLATNMVKIGSEFDNMKISLDTITQGEGEEWFKKLNEWALKMPVNTKKAIQSFTQMRAMGLQPTIEQMTTLVDTTSALGGDADTLSGISRALGQMKTKGKLVTQELLQLAERGVPAFEILREKMGLTSEQLGNIGAQGIDAQTAITALIEGMADRFGGQSEKIQNKWSGLTEALKSYWVEFQRLIMDSGVMLFLETKLKTIADMVTQMYQSGELQQWAQSVSDYIVNLGNDFEDWIASIDDWKGKLGVFIQSLETMAQAIIQVGKAVKATSSFLGKASGAAYTGVEALVSGDVSKIPGAGITDADVDNKWQNTLESRGFDLGVEGAGYKEYAAGTGPQGLPNTGMFKGHQGEIVLNPKESNAMRSGGGGGGGITINVQPMFMSGDANAARTVATEIKRMLGDLTKRTGGGQ